ncbi:MAG TPA: dihydrofolate reductase family protein [Solirubrobacteraceae bacterium]|nr:dihydrofolate reductase family protein [Solirubrobacteraceae bacterium]
MSTICHHTISLDGYIAGPDDSMDWAFAHGRPTALADETMNRLGAILAGRRWYELARERWNGVAGIYGGAYTGPVFVLTHSPPNEGAEARIRFISDGIEAAVATAESAAREKDVGIFGASLSQQCLSTRLLDEIVLHVAPVLLGGGVRLFGDGNDERVELERVSVGAAEGLTDVRFRVVKQRQE